MMARRWLAAILALGLASCAAVAVAADEDGADVVHVTALRNPDVRAYRAIVAGMDRFDALHALAPAVPRLQFRVQAMDGGAFSGGPVSAKLSGDDWSQALAIDADGRFLVPRSQAAWDAQAELMLDQRQRKADIAPEVRTPGLPANQRRLGDLRLECQVQMAIGKEQLGWFDAAALSALLLTTDWCGWFTGDQGQHRRHWWVGTGEPGKLAAATLREGERRLPLRTSGRGFSVPVGDRGWGDDAVVELEYLGTSIRTVGETPRTGP